MKCRFCTTELTHGFVDLQNSPPSNSFLSAHQLNEMEAYFPLNIFVCDSCFLVQIDEFKDATEIFDGEYVYFSSFSKSWLAHAKNYCALMVDRFGLDASSSVVEIASNDGYLLQYFKERNIPVLGIEPTANTAKVAQDKGIETLVKYFGVDTARQLVSEGRKADLLLGNNVLAHVPDINDFVGGMQLLLADDGVITMEFPHLYQLVKFNQFDTIYHEHFSYLSFTTVSKIFEAVGLEMFDVDELPTHGGSLRIYAKHKQDASKAISENVAKMLEKERVAGMSTMAYYENFQSVCEQVKIDFVRFLLDAKSQGKKVAGYGAAAKGNTLMNYCGVKKDLISYVVDANPHKQNKFLPGSHIPVVDEAVLKADRPDYVIIFPWNLKDEIMQQLSYIEEWGGKFVISIPEVKIL